MSENWDVISSFPIDCQFGAMRKSDSRGIVYKAYILLNSNLLYITKTENRTKKFLAQL